MNRTRAMNIHDVCLHFFERAATATRASSGVNGFWSRRANTNLDGGSVFRLVAGVGRPGVLHEARFLELVGTCR